MFSMADIRRKLILVKGADKTESVSYMRIDDSKWVIWISYGGKAYPYRMNDVAIYNNPEEIDISESIVLKNGFQCHAVDTLLSFGEYTRIIYKTGAKSEVVKSEYVSVVHSALSDDSIKNRFNYFKAVASKVGLVSEDGTNILASRFDAIQFIREDSILASYLSGKLSDKVKKEKRFPVFPFGFNISQRTAVENAINHNLSIIEGPPGTGKTQTILNIVANAVMRGESVAVVSSNNSATQNIYEKLQKYGVGFIAAPLGNTDNKEEFIKAQSAFIPDVSKWHLNEEKTAEVKKKMSELGTELKAMLETKNNLSLLNSEYDALRKEYNHFSDIIDSESSARREFAFGKRTSAIKILEFEKEYEMANETTGEINKWQKLKWRIRYGVRGIGSLLEDIQDVLNACENEYYIRKSIELERNIAKLERILRDYDFKGKMELYSDLSMSVFKSKLAEKYKNKIARPLYKMQDLWQRSDSFIKDYPVVLSTTYSLRSSLSSAVVYDYVVVDEASQVDLATGVLAMSCAKRAIIVGDKKQLPNVITSETVKSVSGIKANYDVGDDYDYAKQSLLSSVSSVFPDAPRVLLREHYRCHPEIIGFCNQRFYNGELLVMTAYKSDKQAMMIYKTVKGNHARGHINQRQIDVIQNEIIPQQKLNLDDGSVGIVTPYRDQANLLQDAFSGTSVKADTADKFQGQERSVIILSTVDNKISEFASNPNRLNVAVSRAIDQFILVTDGNENDETSSIHDLIGYIKYQNHDVVQSKIVSVFDFLYKGRETAREHVLRKYGRIGEIESENLMNAVIQDVLSEDAFSKFDVASHVPLKKIVKDYSELDMRELEYITNHLTHVDFLVYSKLTYMPVLVIEVDGYAFHVKNEKQVERDEVKNSILTKYAIPFVRFSTIGSGEKEKLREILSSI